MDNQTKTLLNELLEFAKTKDPQVKYDYSNNSKCALAQFFTAKYGKPVTVFPDIYIIAGELTRELPFELDYVSWSPFDIFKPNLGEHNRYTWGELVSRVEQVLSGEIVLKRVLVRRVDQVI